MNAISFFDERKYSFLPEEFPDSNVYPLYSKATKTEIVLEEGEMVFIPAGWWHHVFSEEVGESGVNIAFNFWYNCPEDFDEGVSGKEIPYKKLSGLSVPDPMSLLKSTTNLRVFKSTSRRFTSDRISYKYPGTLEVVNMTFDEFMKKDPYTYVLQFNLLALDDYAPTHTTKLKESSIWANFGNVYSHLHYDLYDNYLCQVQGSRRVILFPPEDRDYLYPLNPYPLSILKQLTPKPVKKLKVLIGTYSHDGYVSSIYDSSMFGTSINSESSEIKLDSVIMNSEGPERSVRNEFVHMALKGNYTHLFIINRDLSWNGGKFLESIPREYDVVGVPYVYGEHYKLDIPSSPKETTGVLETNILPFGFIGFTRKVLEKLWLDAPVVNGIFDKEVRDIFDCDDNKMCQKIKDKGFTLSVFTDYAADRMNHGPVQGESILELQKRAQEAKT